MRQSSLTPIVICGEGVHNAQPGMQDPDDAPGGATAGAPQQVFDCAICFDEHSMEDCYIASACGHRMCRDAAREVVLNAIRCEHCCRDDCL